MTDPDRQARARAYAAIRHRLFFVDLGVGLFYLSAWLFTGLAAWLARSLPGPWPVALALHIAVAGGLFGLATAPLSYYSGYVLSKRYGLSVQTRPSWLADRAKSAGIGFGLGLVVVEAVYWLIATYPAAWWLPAAGMMLVFTVGLAMLAPVVILPLFYRLSPIGDAELVERIRRLAGRAGTRIRGVYQMRLSEKSTTANAMLMGLGQTRRVVLTDTLIDRYTPAEIEVVLAHELGHHVHRDLVKGVVTSAASTLIAFWLADRLLAGAVGLFGLAGPADPAGLPVVVFALGAVGIGLGPVANVLSRRWETVADRFALDLTRDPAAFRTLMLKLADQNLAEIAPPRWVEIMFHDHPPIARRLALAEAWQRSEAAGGLPAA